MCHLLPSCPSSWGPARWGLLASSITDPDTSHHSPPGLSKVSLSFSPLCRPGRGFGEGFTVSGLPPGRCHLLITSRRGLGDPDVHVSASDGFQKWDARWKRLRGGTHRGNEDGQETLSPKPPAHGRPYGYECGGSSSHWGREVCFRLIAGRSPPLLALEGWTM